VNTDLLGDVYWDGVVGSTELAARERPERVVELLNELFSTVASVVQDEDGLSSSWFSSFFLRDRAARGCQPSTDAGTRRFDLA
jgi:nucleoid DNA-binding protein